MSTTYLKYFNNPAKLRLYANNSADLFNYQMNNIMDGFFDNAMNQSTDGTFKAVCLSGIKTEDNDGGSQNPEDALVDPFGYARIILKPLTSFGNLLASPLSYTDPIDINQSILIHGSMFSARSDFFMDGTNMPEFGQVVNCYFENGSIGSSKFTQMRFAESKVKEFDDRYVKLATIEGVNTAFGAFEEAGGFGNLLGELDEEGLDPRYPPREWLYVGSDQRYYNSMLQNGNLPSDLLAPPSGQALGKHKPTMLAELTSEYESMAVEFRKKFPNKKLSAWGYRPYSRQLSIKVEKPNLAAKPGTSTHGWGQAIDIHFYVDGSSKRLSLKYSGEEYKWLAANSKKYGWYNPPWASQGGKKEEPWHWESTKTIFTKR